MSRGDEGREKRRLRRKREEGKGEGGREKEQEGWRQWGEEKRQQEEVMGLSGR